MTDAVIVSTARTPLAKSWKGAFNMTHGATLGGHAVKAAVERAGIDPAAVDDVLMGCANPEGATGMQHRAPDRAARRPADHHRRASRSTASAPAACRPSRWRAARHRGRGRCLRRRRRREHLVRAAGDEPAHADRTRRWQQSKPEIYWTMLQTAETRGQALQHPQASAWTNTAPRASRRPAPAQEAGKFKDEIAPITVTAGVADAVLGLRSKEVTVDKRRRPAPRHHARRHQGHPPGDAGRRDHRRQCQPVQRRRRRLRDRQRQLCAEEEPEAARPLPRLRGGRLRARRDGHRPGVRGAQGAAARWA